MVFFLIGMPGTGKSSIGKNVAKLLDFSFIDLDKLIERKSNCSITEIWQKFGVDYFRVLESKTLKDISTVENTIVSCGGGTPCYFENIDWMNNHGYTLFMLLPIEVLAKRIFGKKGNRPMFSQIETSEKIENKLMEIYEERKLFYQSAKHQIKLKGTFPGDILMVKEKIFELMNSLDYS